MNRGVEIASTVADDSRSVIREQVEMGVAVRMAVLEALARNLPNDERNRRAPPEQPSPAATVFINARIVDPRSNRDEPGGLLVRDGVIADIGPHLRRNAPEGVDVVDCKGHVLAPA